MCGVTILHGPLVTAQVCPVPPLREHLTFMVLVKPKVNENGEAEPSQDRTSPFPTPIHVPKAFRAVFDRHRIESLAVEGGGAPCRAPSNSACGN